MNHPQTDLPAGSLPLAEETAAPPVAPATSGRLARSAGLIGLATMASRIFGLARDQVLAFLFGAGDEIDAFNVAFRFPNLVRDLFAEGAMSAAFVPTFTRYLARHGKAGAWRLGNQVITALIVITTSLVLAGIVFARPLVEAFAGDYARVTGKLDLTITLTRIMFPFLTLVAVAAALMGMLNSLHRFFLPALSPVMFNVGTIICAFVAVPLMPSLGLPPIAGIAVGALVGGLGQIAIQWPALRREGFRYRPALDPSDPGLREVLLLMGPGVLGLAAVQINLFVNTVLATSQGTGAVSWLNYAFRLMYLPIGLFGVSIATAALPAVSRHAAADDVEGMRQTLSSALRLMLMLNVPATFGLIALASPIIALIFEHGRFTAADTAATAGALVCYAPGLIGYSSVRLASPTFYALGSSRTPVIVSVIVVAVNVVLNLTLVRVLGYQGLALGTAIASLLNAAVLLWLLQRRLHGLDERRIAVAFAKIAVASLVMAIAARGADWWVASVLQGGGTLGQLARVGAGIGVGLLALALSARALGIREFGEAVHAARARMTRLGGRT